MPQQEEVRRISRRDLLKAAGAAGLAAVLGGCAPEPTPTPRPTGTPTPIPTGAPTPIPTATPIYQAPKRGGILTEARTVEAVGLDPHVNTNLEAPMRLMPLMYDCLVVVDPEYQLMPQIAESWEMKDERTYVFYLRKEVKFHNGRELTVEDVKYTFDRILDPETGASAPASNIPDVDSVDILNSDTIQFKLKEPNATFGYNLYRCFIVPQEVQDNPTDFLMSNVIGTGPFMLDEWKPDTEMKLVRNPDYWKADLPYLDGITIRIFPEEPTAIAALRAGAVDHFTLDDANNFELLKLNPDIDLTLLSTPGPVFMNFNDDKSPMNDLKVRQAMSQALDRSEFVRVVGAGLGSVSGILTPAFRDYFLPPEELPFYDYNPDKAKQLLKESSVPDGFKMDCLFITTSPVMKGQAELCKAYWEDIGIEVELRGLESTVWVNTVIETRDFYFTTNLTLQGPTPEQLLTNMVACESYMAELYGPCFPELDDMVIQAKAMTDMEARKDLWKDIQIFVAEHLPLITTYAPTEVDAKQRWVKDFRTWPDKVHRGWEYVWLDKA